MDRIPAYILAGGKSSRFGSDKARALLQGEPAVVRVAKLIAPAVSRVTIVAHHAGKYADLGMHTIGDHQPGLGPLTGLQTALRDLTEQEAWLLLCPCDALIIKPHWLEQLSRASTFRAAAVAFRGERWQPMPALYARSCLPRVERRLHDRVLDMQGLLDDLDTVPLPVPTDWTPRWQFNTRNDLDAAVANLGDET